MAVEPAEETPAATSETAVEKVETASEEAESETAEEFEELLNDYKDNEQLLQTINTSIDNVINNDEKKEKLIESKITFA